MSAKLATHRGACRQVSQVQGFIACGAAVCLGVALLQPAEAMRPEHQLIDAALSQARRNAPSGPQVTTVAAHGLDVNASADTNPQHTPPASTRRQLVNASKVSLHLLEVKPHTNSKSPVRHTPGEKPDTNWILVSKDMDWHALESGSSGAEGSVMVPISILRVLSEPVAAGPNAELSVLPDCQERRVGCKGGCQCRWHEQCYTKKSSVAPFADTGMCGLSMTMMVLATVATSGSLLFFTMSLRLWLQDRDFSHEHEQMILRRPSMMGPLAGMSVLDEFASRRKMVHDQRLVRKTLGHFPEDPVATARKEILMLRQGET